MPPFLIPGGAYLHEAAISWLVPSSAFSPQAGAAVITHVPAGGFALGGAPTITHVTGVWEHAPGGGFALGGAPTITHVRLYIHSPAGGFALGGAPVITHIVEAHTHAPAGGFALGGAPTITRLGTEGAYAFDWIHQWAIRAVRYEAIVMEHTFRVVAPINGDGIVQVHTWAVGDAALRALFGEDLQRPVATGEIILPD